jgi:conjugal transfer pilus assembly protein TraA
MDHSLTLPAMPSEKLVNNNKSLVIATLCALFLILSFDSIAGSGGAAFTSIWTEISGWADGVPGKIITLLAFFASLFNVLKQNYYLAVGAFIGGMLLSQSVAIINIFLTGTI